MKEFFKNQLESFIDTHNGILSDIRENIATLHLTEMGINLLSLLCLIILYFINLVFYIGSTIVVGGILFFKYINFKVKELFYGR